MDNINFCGGFFLEKPVRRSVWTCIKNELPKHKCIIENLYDEGDKFFSVKSIYDKDIASLILRKNVKFKFYPDINLKVAMDAYYPEEARKTLSMQNNVITTKDGLREHLRKMVRPNVILLKKYNWTPEDHIEKTLKLLGVKESDCKIKIKSGITFIYDNQGKVLAKASPNDIEGINYVYICPKNSDGFSRKIALTQSGLTYEFGTSQYKTFLKKFKNNIKIDSNRKRPQK